MQIFVSLYSLMGLQSWCMQNIINNTKRCIDIQIGAILINETLTLLQIHLVVVVTGLSPQGNRTFDPI